MRMCGRTSRIKGMESMMASLNKELSNDILRSSFDNIPASVTTGAFNAEVVAVHSQPAPSRPRKASVDDDANALACLMSLGGAGTGAKNNQQ